MTRLMTVSRSLHLIAGAVVLLVIGITAQHMIRSRELLIDNTTNEMSRLDMVLAAQTGRAVETVDVILRDAVEAMQASRGLPPGKLDAIDDLLARRVADLRQVSEIALTDAAGRVLHSSKPGPLGGLPEVAKPLLAEARSAKALPLVSRPMLDADGRWISLLVRPVDDGRGGFAGLAVAFLSLRYFEDFYQDVRMEDGGAIVLHRADGVVLARYPRREDVIGTSYADQPPFKDILFRRPVGAAVLPSPEDGAQRVLAIRAINFFPLAMNVSVDLDDVLAGWRRSVRVVAGTTLLAVLTIGGLLLLTARRSSEIERLMAQTRAERATTERAGALLDAQTARRKALEASLRQAERTGLAARVMGGVAGDVDSLLDVVAGNIDLVEPSLARDARNAARLATMRAAAARAAALTRQALLFAGRRPATERTADVGDVIAGRLELLRSVAGPRVRVELRAASVPRACIDPHDLETLLLDMATDARDEMGEPGGVLTIRVRPTSVEPGSEAAGGGLEPGDYVMILFEQAPSTRAAPPGPTDPAGARPWAGERRRQASGIAWDAGGDIVSGLDAEGRETVRIVLPASAARPRESVLAGAAGISAAPV